MRPTRLDSSDASGARPIPKIFPPCRIASALRKSGTPIPTNDIWIAAHAFETGAELIIFDRHFEAVRGLPVTILPKNWSR